MERILSELEGFSRGSLNSVETQVTTADGRKVSPCIELYVAYIHYLSIM